MNCLESTDVNVPPSAYEQKMAERESLACVRNYLTSAILTSLL